MVDMTLVRELVANQRMPADVVGLILADMPPADRLAVAQSVTVEESQSARWQRAVEIMNNPNAVSDLHLEPGVQASLDSAARGLAGTSPWNMSDALALVSHLGAGAGPDAPPGPDHGPGPTDGPADGPDDGPGDGAGPGPDPMPDPGSDALPGGGEGAP